MMRRSEGGLEKKKLTLEGREFHRDPAAKKKASQRCTQNSYQIIDGMLTTHCNDIIAVCCCDVCIEEISYAF